MKQLTNESRNRELAALMYKKSQQGGKLNDKDRASLAKELGAFNFRVSSRRSKKPINWESGRDARAEGHIATATRGVSKVKKSDARKAAEAHGDVKKECKRLTSTGELITEQGIKAKALKWLGGKFKGLFSKTPTPTTPPIRTSKVLNPKGKPTEVPLSAADEAAAAAAKKQAAKQAARAETEAATKIGQDLRVTDKARGGHHLLRHGKKYATGAGGLGATYGAHKAYTGLKQGLDTGLEAGGKKIDVLTTTVDRLGGQVKDWGSKQVDTAQRKISGATTAVKTALKDRPISQRLGIKDKKGNYTKGAKIAGAVGAGYVAKKALDDD